MMNENESWKRVLWVMSVVVYFFAVAGLIGFLSSGCASEMHWQDPQCVRHLYPSHNGDVPVCQAMVDYYGCETFDDYNGDGVNDIQELLDFCQTERDGDSLTLDVDSIPPGGSMRADWCYTCD